MARKILHVSHSLEIGGGPLYIEKIINDIPAYDHYVAGTPGKYFILFQSRLGIDRVVKLKQKNIIINVILLFRFCRRHEIDIIHAHGRGSALYSRIVKLFMPRVYLCYTIHGFFPELLLRPVRWAYVVLENILYTLTDKIIHVSETEQKMFKKCLWTVSERKHVYVPNYVDVLGPTAGHRTLLGVTLLKEEIKLLFVGRLVPQKGVDFLLQAIKKVNDPALHLYVIGYGAQEADLQRFINENPYLKITFLGKVSDAASLMPHFDGLILPSRMEGMPFTLLEAMKARISLIVTPVRGIIDVVSAQSSYMAKETSGRALAEAVASFISDYKNHPSAIKEKIERAYDLVSSEFGKDYNVRKLNSIYGMKN